MRTLDDIADEYAFLDDRDDRSRLLIDLGKELEPMPPALKTEATLVRGCSAAVWAYPTRNADGGLHFLADSTSGITKGLIALVLAAVQDKQPRDVLAVDFGTALKPFEVEKQLSSNRTSGIPNMIALVRATAERLDEATGSRR